MPHTKKIATLRNVSYSYPAGNSAVEKVSLTLFASEIVGLVGSNGSGKTTLLKLLSGYMSITGGYVELNMSPIEEYSEKMLNDFVTLVEQNPESQLVGPTVEDELARTCRLMGLKGREIKDKVTEVLKDMNMGDAREWFLDEMSNGERRRVALGLALLGNPSLLLLDEPLSDLDDDGVRATLEFLQKYKEKGTSILVTSHTLDDLLRFTDRIAIFGQGSLLLIGKPEAVIRNADVLKKASVKMPAVPGICIELEAAGMLSFEHCPMDLEEAIKLIHETAAAAK